MENKRVRKAFNPHDFEFGTLATQNDFPLPTGGYKRKSNKQAYSSNYSAIANANKPTNTFWYLSPSISIYLYQSNLIYPFIYLNIFQGNHHQ
jgi:hypothetical protein